MPANLLWFSIKTKEIKRSNKFVKTKEIMRTYVLRVTLLDYR